MAVVRGDFCVLIERIKQGSEDAAWELVEQYGDEIRRAVRRVLHPRLRSKFDSLDFVQMVWNSFFKARDRVTCFTRPEELVAFLIAVARNKVGMEVRRRLGSEKDNVTREETLNVHAEELHRPADSNSDPFEVAVAREQWNRLIVPRAGILLQELSLKGGDHKSKGRNGRIKLDDLGISRLQSARWQMEAELPEEEFAEYVNIRD